MTVTLAPRWALSGLAVRDESSGWLAKGVHLRILISPALGFPLHPFLIYPLGSVETEKLHAGDWSVEDDQGFLQSAPFDVHRDNGLRAILIDQNAACPFVTVEGSGDLRVDVVADGPSGPNVVMSRSRAPWELGGCQITQLRITGEGQVTDIVGLFAGGGQGNQEIHPEMIGLPITKAKFYRGPMDAAALADARVQDDQPQRVSLVDDPIQPPGIAVDESARVAVASNELADWFIKAVDGVSSVVADATLVSRAPGGPHTKPWTTTTDPIGSVLTAAWDPGLARWLGLLWTDRTPPPAPPPVPAAWLYGIRAVWAIDAERLLYSPRFDGDSPPKLIDALPISPDPDEARQIINQIDDPELTHLVDNLPPGMTLAPLTAIVGAAIVAEPDLPDAPILTSSRQGAWRAGVAGGPARRSVSVGFASAPPGSIAFARDTTAGSMESLSRQYVDNAPWRAPIVVGRPTDGTLPIEIRDSDASDRAPEYFVARSDAVGRWGDWASIPGPGPTRPAVPIPHLQVTLHLPPDPVPTDDAPLPAHLRVEVGVPLAAQVEPGAFPISRVGITRDATPEEWFDLPAPEVDVFVLADVAGPSLGRAETRAVSFVARFEDTAGRKSEFSASVTRQLRDPRPPPHVVLSGPLHYASRTGRDGQARALIDWAAPASNVRYRVYMAYEPELRAKLAASGGGAVVAALDQAHGAGERAAVYFTNGLVLPQAAFHVVTSEPIVPAGGRGRHEQPLPGGLPGLAIFKVIPMSEALVEADWAHGAVAIYAVPDERAPTAPLLRLRLVPTGVEATISVARGTRHTAKWRLRRIKSIATEMVFMPIVNRGSVMPAGADGAVPAVVAIDEVSISPDSMDRWTYVAEVQGESEDAAVDRPDRPTPWSPPSRPASIVVVATDPPSPVASGTAIASAAVADQVDVELFHPGKLTSDMDLPFRIEAYRVVDPAAAPVLAVSLDADADVAAGGRPPGADGPFRLADPTGAAATAYMVVVVDPLGRRSQPLTIPVGGNP